MGIKKTLRLYNGRVNPQYEERIQIKMVDEAAIKFIAEFFGGNYHKEKTIHKNRRTLYYYCAGNKKAVMIIKTIFPYLKVKRIIAQKILDFRELKNNSEKIAIKTTIKSRWGKLIEINRSRYSKEYIEKLDNFWSSCKMINHGKYV